MMSRFISPPRDQLDTLRQRLTDGERRVFEFFDARLHQDWEIYIQPHLNGLRPDFVLLHERVGIAVFEVKDWNLDAMEYWVKQTSDRAPVLMGRRAGQSFSLQSHNPVEQLHRYRQEIIELYCPRLARRAGLAVITAGIIFPNADCERVKELLKPCLMYRGLLDYKGYNPISGLDTLESGHLPVVFPEGVRQNSKFMTPDLAKDLRNWLVEPDFSAIQREPLDLDDNQKRVMKRTALGYRRIKGPAGSGKSLVLAARAAQLASEGKEVLVVTYNITLIHYLRDLAARWPHSHGSIGNITWLNFHYWCKRVCQENNYEKAYKQLWKEYFSNQPDSEENPHDEDDARGDILHHQLPELVLSIIDNDTEKHVKHYDAVLVDEGQDFRLNWWNVLRKVCKPRGEVLLVADKTQDIYGTARAWTDNAMRGAGFRGDWAKLHVSYRLPPTLITYARDFAERFLPNDLVDLPESPQRELDFYPCKLRWVQTTKERAIEVCVQEILKMPPLADPETLAIPDITFLVGSQNIGLEVVKELGKKGIKCVHTFNPDSQESRRLKLGFYMGDARVKATTLHSFKGWETRALVVYTGHVFNHSSKALAYIGMTRLKRHQKSSLLTVVSSISELAGYGRTWTEFDMK